MADFALGLTKTAVEGTLSRVRLAIDEENKLKATAHQDLLFITGEFQMMQSFLLVANKERASNEVVKTWVRQLRDLAFDVENCVEFVVHLDNNSAWTWLWRLVPSFMAPPRHLDQAVAELKQLKARVEEVSQRNTRYNLISDSGSNSSSTLAAAVEEPAAQVTTRTAAAFRLLRDVWAAAGKRRDMCDLQKVITSESDDLRVVSLWGSSGSDFHTTDVINKVYFDPEVCQDFKCRAWVKLMHPFTPDEFVKSLLTQFYASSGQTIAAASMEDGVKELVSKHKYLVVIEELSSQLEWDAITMYLTCTKNSSRIIVCTNNLRVAVLCTGPYPYQVSELRRSDDESLCIFFNKDFGCRNDFGELIWQIKRHGVISVWGTGDDKSILVSNFFDATRTANFKERFGVTFETRRWVLLYHPFDSRDFMQRLLLGIYFGHESDPDIGEMEDEQLVQECRKFIRAANCLFVFEVVQSNQEWDWIKHTILTEPTKSCFIVLANELNVATYCTGHHSRALNNKDLMADRALHPFIKPYKYKEKAYRGINNRFLSNRRIEAQKWLERTEIVGHMDEVKKLEKFLENPNVISVWGIAGMGKSSLVRSIYYNRMSIVGKCTRVQNDECFGYSEMEFMAFSWVDVPHPFNLEEFSRRLLIDFHSDDLEAMETASIGLMEGQDPIQECFDLLHEDKCLVVIDGLRSSHEWDLIKAAFLSKIAHGCIVVITTEEDVAIHCADDKRLVINVKGLQADVALKLFNKVAWGSRELTDNMTSLSKVITAKCGGIPKLIATIAKSCNLATEKEESDSAISLLEFLSVDFRSKLECQTEFKDLFSWMESCIQSCFDASPDSLKPCILYLSVFCAENYIRRRRLVRRWIAEGYSRDKPGSTMEENGKMYFSELIKLSIIQKATRATMWQVNGFFREYISSRPMEDNLVFELKGRCSLNSQRAGQHLAIRECWDRDVSVYETIDFSQLRSLTVFGKWKEFFISRNINMRVLRVLDLEDTIGVTNGDLDKIGKFLSRLKFLSIRGCKEVDHLPDSLGRLRQLQTLDIYGTSIVALPWFISKLHKIQYIRAGTIMPLVSDVKPKQQAEDDDHDTEQRSIPIAATPPHRGQGTTPMLPATNKIHEPTPSCSWPRSTVSWLSKLMKVREANAGVKVLARIRKLTALHTLGVVDVKGAAGRNILKELEKLTQLRKLRIAGLDADNTKDFCFAISGHGYLESLSVHLEKDNQGSFACLDGIAEAPKTLKSLKLYGHVHKFPSWIKQLDNLKKLDIELTIQAQEDTCFFAQLPRKDILRQSNWI